MHSFPRNEPNFHNMFIDDCPHPQYSEKWFFGFSSLDEATQWVNGSLEQDELGIFAILREQAVLKEVVVPEPFVIKGEKQLIFQKEHMVYEKVVDFNLLSTNYSTDMDYTPDEETKKAKPKISLSI